MKRFLLLFILLFWFSPALANDAEEMAASLWMRGPTASFEQLCKGASFVCEVKHYSIDYHQLGGDVEKVMVDTLEHSLLQVHLKLLPQDQMKDKVLEIMKFGGVQQDPTRLAAFRGFLRWTVSPADSHLEMKFYDGVGLTRFASTKHFYVLLKSAEYQTAEVLEFYGGHQD